VKSKAKRLAIAGFVLLLAAMGSQQLLPASDFLQGVLYGAAFGSLLAAALRSFMPDACDQTTPRLRRRYQREFLPAMIGYAVLLFVSMWLLKRVDDHWLRAAIALLPVPPIALAIRAIVRYIRDVDELQQRIELEAVSVATAFVSLLYMAGALLQLAKVIDIRSGIAMLWMFPLVCLTYGFAKVALSRRYA
jgi:hypothetical protein